MDAVFIYDEAYTQYRFHADHPFNPIRLEATHDLAQSLGILQPAALLHPRPATIDDLLLAHSPHYVDLVQRLGETGRTTYGIERLGLGTDDNPVFAGMHDAARWAVGGTVRAAVEVANGRTRRALNLAGGLHHAGHGHASGFCIYNDVVVAIRWLRRETGWRILYVETDAHHGDGVQQAFYEDPDVFVLSLHESGQYLFPGTGAVSETGAGPGRGTTLNVPLAPATDDASWLDLYRRVVPEAIRRFQPDLVLSQHGCDGHYWDPLADLCATTRFYTESVGDLARWIQAYTPGRWIAVGGGGYQTLSVVPRVWTLLWSQLIGAPLDDKTPVPAPWLADWQPHAVQTLPTALYDRPEQFHPIRDQHRMRKSNQETLAALSRQFPAWDFDTPR